ncbi:MAG: hypothetical protein QW145_01335 [Candidatus Bathyarchaeia archaeon]
MRKTILLAALGLVALSAIIISTYSASAWHRSPELISRAGSTPTSAGSICASNAHNFTWTFKRCWRMPLEGKRCKGFFGYNVELSEGFREKVLGIASGDGDVQKLLSEGYNVSDIKVAHVRFTVQDNGQITMEADKAILLLVKSDGGRAFVEVDLKAEKVTRIVIVNVTVIEKGTAT